MRTIELYRRIKEYLDYGISIPSDLVVRLKKDGNWIIESRAKPQQETVLEVTLEDFWNYWNSVFGDMIINQNYCITKSDIRDYVQFVKYSQDWTN